MSNEKSNIEKLQEICKDNVLPTNPKDDGITIEINAGNKKYPLFFNEVLAKKTLVHAPNFYKYRLVEGYEAIWSETLGCVECAIRLSTSPDFSKYPPSWNVLGISKEKSLINIPSPIDGTSISVEYSASIEWFILTTLRTLPLPNRYVTSLKHLMLYQDVNINTEGMLVMEITNLNITRHDDVVKLIESLFYSICFDISCKTGVHYTPCAQQKESSVSDKTDDEESPPIYSPTQPIQRMYDKEAFSLYSYAYSATHMPLLQFLAFYQVIEFYYPVYSDKGARTNLQNILKDPRFDCENEQSLTRLLDTIKVSNELSEPGQLMATIRLGINIEELKEFLKAFDSCFFSSNSDSGAKKLSQFVILNPEPAHNKNPPTDEELIKSVCQRIYNIRCRIVHTKDEGSTHQVLHPRSEEIAYLENDIKLVHFLAERLLIASSKPFNLTLSK